MISLHRLYRQELIVGYQAQILNKRRLMFSRVDLSAEQRYASSMVLGLVDKIECIVRGSCRTAQYAYNQ
jgi:hypothetical protein